MYFRPAAYLAAMAHLNLKTAQPEFSGPARKADSKRDGINYKTTIGFSSVLENRSGHGGLALHTIMPISISADLPALSADGIDGDATALILGARWYGDAWYIGTVVSRLKTMKPPVKDIYFDGTGWEVYAQYNVQKMVGCRWLEQTRAGRSEIQAGDFQCRL